MTNDLPIEWITTQLENVAIWGSGGTPSRGNSNYYGGEIPWIKTGDLGPKVLYKSSEFITVEGLNSSSAKVFPKGSVILAMYGATIGKVSILGISATTNQACAVGQPIEDIVNNEYLYYFLLSQKEDFIAKSIGGAQPNISQMIIKKHEIVIAPLAEQKVIAGKLDDMLAKVERIKARLERIPQVLKQFRQSVLADAVSGKLTEDWRKSNEYILLNETLPYPNNWVVSTLGEALNYGKCLKRDSGKIELNKWVLELEDIEKDSSRLLDKLTFEKRQSKSTKNEFKKGDVLYGKLRPYLNKVIIADEDGLCTTEIIPISPTEKLLSFYIFIWLKSPFFIEYVNRITYGVNMPRLGTDDGKAAPIVIPPIAEQKEITRLVTTLFDYADNVEKQTLSALEKINSLTQSILSKAFKGELTEQWRLENPELINGENSAESLLKKILIERDLINKLPKTRAANIKKKTIMNKITKQEINNWVASRKGEPFTFEELQAFFNSDYEQLKEFLFEVLCDDHAVFKQSFDDASGSIQFVGFSR